MIDIEGVIASIQNKNLNSNTVIKWLEESAFLREDTDIDDVVQKLILRGVIIDNEDDLDIEDSESKNLIGEDSSHASLEDYDSEIDDSEDGDSIRHELPRFVTKLKYEFVDDGMEAISLSDALSTIHASISKNTDMPCYLVSKKIISSSGDFSLKNIKAQKIVFSDCFFDDINLIDIKDVIEIEIYNCKGKSFKLKNISSDEFCVSIKSSAINHFYVENSTSVLSIIVDDVKMTSLNADKIKFSSLLIGHSDVNNINIQRSNIRHFNKSIYSKDNAHGSDGSPSSIDNFFDTTIKISNSNNSTSFKFTKSNICHLSISNSLIKKFETEDAAMFFLEIDESSISSMMFSKSFWRNKNKIHAIDISNSIISDAHLAYEPWIIEDSSTFQSSDTYLTIPDKNGVSITSSLISNLDLVPLSDDGSITITNSVFIGDKNSIATKRADACLDQVTLHSSYLMRTLISSDGSKKLKITNPQLKLDLFETLKLDIELILLHDIKDHIGLFYRESKIEVRYMQLEQIASQLKIIIKDAVPSCDIKKGNNLYISGVTSKQTSISVQVPAINAIQFKSDSDDMSDFILNASRIVFYKSELNNITISSEHDTTYQYENDWISFWEASKNQKTIDISHCKIKNMKINDFWLKQLGITSCQVSGKIDLHDVYAEELISFLKSFHQIDIDTDNEDIISISYSEKLDISPNLCLDETEFNDVLIKDSTFNRFDVRRGSINKLKIKSSTFQSMRTWRMPSDIITLVMPENATSTEYQCIIIPVSVLDQSSKQCNLQGLKLKLKSDVLHGNTNKIELDPDVKNPIDKIEDCFIIISEGYFEEKRQKFNELKFPIVKFYDDKIKSIPNSDVFELDNRTSKMLIDTIKRQYKPTEINEFQLDDTNIEFVHKENDSSKSIEKASFDAFYNRLETKLINKQKSMIKRPKIKRLDIVGSKITTRCFSGIDFNDTVSISSHSILHDSAFSFSLFNTLSLDSSIILGERTFFGIRSNGLTTIQSCVFDKSVKSTFDYAEFVNKITINDIIIEKDISFKSAQFHDSLNLNDFALNKPSGDDDDCIFKIDFSKTRFERSFSITTPTYMRAEKKQILRLNLDDCTVKKVIDLTAFIINEDDLTHLQTELSLYGISYDEFIIASMPAKNIQHKKFIYNPVVTNEEVLL